MIRFRTAVAMLALVLMACGGAGPSSCTEYAADLRNKSATMSSEELSAYVDETAEDVARLISDDPLDAQVCAEVILEVLFTAGLDDVFSGLED